MRKKNFLAAGLAAILIFNMSCYWTSSDSENVYAQTTPAVTEIPGTDRTESEIDASFFSVSGFAKGKVNDRSNFKEGDEEYAVANNEKEFMDALRNARSGVIKVIELRSDMYLGWWEMSEEAKSAAGSMLSVYEGTDTINVVPVGNPVLIESGISTLTLDEIDGLTIFSENGATIKHTEIKLNSKCNDIVIRNINFTESWEWDDWTRKGYGSTGGKGTAKRSGFTYLKINGAHNIWVDHCNFGIAFDGNLDIENGSNGISLTWCRFGDVDYSKGSMLYRAINYFEDIYEQSKVDNNTYSFVIYGTARDNGVTPEEMALYMGYHKKCHLVGAGDKDTWLYMDEDGKLVKDESKTDANELLRVSFGYNAYINQGSRLPLLRGGVGHLYNCYVDDYNVSKASKIFDRKNEAGNSVKKEIENAGGQTHFLARGLNPRCGAAVAADTCDFYYVSEPLLYAEEDKDMGAYTGWFGKNYGLIVNSRVKRNASSEVYEGSSWDNNGVNAFTSNVTWDDKSTIGNWKWGQEGDKLPYAYKTFPLDKVKEYTEEYGGCEKIDFSCEEWLKTEYASDSKIKTESNEEIPVENISLNYDKRTVYMGEYLQLYEKVSPYNTTETGVDFKWESSDSSVATVSDCGLVKPLKCGNTVVTVRTKSGKEASCNVTVEALPFELNVVDVPKTLYQGDICRLEAQVTPSSVTDKSVCWTRLSNIITMLDKDNGIFKVEDNTNSTRAQVKVQTLMKGNRIYDNTLSKTLSFTIKKPAVPVTGINAKNTNISLGKGESITADAVTIPEDATNKRIYYSIDDENVATVDSNGCITAQNPGVTTMSAITMNYGYEKTYTITVKEQGENLIMGDANQDGIVDLSDALISLKAALGIEDLKDNYFKAADIDESGVIELNDVLVILKMALGII